MRRCGLSRRDPELGPEPRLLRHPLSGLSPIGPFEGLGSGWWARLVRKVSAVVFMYISLACKEWLRRKSASHLLFSLSNMPINVVLLMPLVIHFKSRARRQV
jgi:hypothetical protein